MKPIDIHPGCGLREIRDCTGTADHQGEQGYPHLHRSHGAGKPDLYRQEQALITALGMTDHGTMQYSLTEGQHIQPGHPYRHRCRAYTVWYQVIGDENHNDTAPASVAVRIGQKPLTIPGVTAASSFMMARKNAGITSVTFDNVILNRDTDYNVTASLTMPVWAAARERHCHSDPDRTGSEELRPGAEQLPHDWQHHQGRCPRLHQRKPR